MALINNATREVTAKIVYYGAGLCGKTTNLKHIYDTLPMERKGKMISLSTETDRTLFFDFLPIELGRIKDFRTRVQLYTVPGQVFYDATRKLVLQGVDGVVFVVDSQSEMLQSNEESFENLTVNLAEKKIDVADIPLVFQYNKRDLPNILPVDELDRRLNELGRPYYEASAIRGDGVQETFRGICRLVLESLGGKFTTAEREVGAQSGREIEEEVLESHREVVQSAFPSSAPPRPAAPEVVELPLDIEPDVARAATEQALDAGLVELEEAFPFEPEEAGPLPATKRADEDFISLSDLEEIADIQEIIGEESQPLAPPVQPPPRVVDMPLEEVASDVTVTASVPSFIREELSDFEQAPPPRRKVETFEHVIEEEAIGAAAEPPVEIPVVELPDDEGPTVEEPLLEAPVEEALPIEEPLFEAPVEIPTEEPLPAELLVPPPAAEIPVVVEEVPLAVAVPASAVAPAEIVVPVDLSSLGIKQLPEGLELKFTIKLLFTKPGAPEND